MIQDGKIYVGDIGTRIRLDVGEDVSTATSVTIEYKKPSKVEGSWSAAVEVENNTIVYHMTALNELDEAGEWKLQAYVDLGQWKGLSETVNMMVYKKFT